MFRSAFPPGFHGNIHRAALYASREADARRHEASFKTPPIDDQDRGEVRSALARAASLDQATDAYHQFASGAGAFLSAHRPPPGGPLEIREDAARSVAALRNDGEKLALWVPVFFDAAVERRDFSSAEALAHAALMIEDIGLHASEVSGQVASQTLGGGAQRADQSALSGIWRQSAVAIRSALSARLDRALEAQRSTGGPRVESPDADPLLSKLESWRETEQFRGAQPQAQLRGPGCVQAKFAAAEAAAAAVGRGLGKTREAHRLYDAGQVGPALHAVTSLRWAFVIPGIQRSLEEIPRLLAPVVPGDLQPWAAQQIRPYIIDLTTKTEAFRVAAQLSRSEGEVHALGASVTQSFEACKNALRALRVPEDEMQERFHPDRSAFTPLVDRLGSLQGALEADLASHPLTLSGLPDSRASGSPPADTLARDFARTLRF